MAWNGWDWAVVIVVAAVGLVVLGLGILRAVHRRHSVDHPPVTDEMVARHPSNTSMRSDPAAGEKDS